MCVCAIFVFDVWCCKYRHLILYPLFLTWEQTPKDGCFFSSEFYDLLFKLIQFMNQIGLRSFNIERNKNDMYKMALAIYVFCLYEPFEGQQLLEWTVHQVTGGTKGLNNTFDLFKTLQMWKYALFC